MDSNPITRITELANDIQATIREIQSHHDLDRVYSNQDNSRKDKREQELFWKWRARVLEVLQEKRESQIAALRTAVAQL
jgi:hypothetical protein